MPSHESPGSSSTMSLACPNSDARPIASGTVPSKVTPSLSASSVATSGSSKNFLKESGSGAPVSRSERSSSGEFM